MGFVVTLAGMPDGARAQSSDQAAAKAQARFSELDVNRDAVLSSAEFEACRCRQFDTDRNGQITKAEFYLGFMLAAFEAQPQGREAAAPTVAVRGPHTVGDRVELKIGDRWYPGVIYAARGDQYQINRDNFGRSQWIAGELRGEQQPVALRPMVGKRGDGPFLFGERVEVTIGGVSYRGNIGAREPGTDLYEVDRYSERPGAAAQSEDITGAQIRRLEVTPAATVPASLPRTVPTGLYVCTTYAGANTTTLGRLRILGPASYTGLTPDGSGPQRRYTYDPATGGIEWVGGMPNLTAILQRSEYRASANGRAEITVWYKVAEGRFDLTMGCRREGE
jgi:hypothetical protein